MRKNCKCYTLLAALVLGGCFSLVSCGSDDDNPQNHAASVHLNAPSLNEGGNSEELHWRVGDSIYVTVANPHSYYAYDGVKFTFAAESGTTKMNFAGVVPEGSELGPYAVYPYNDQHQFAGKKVLNYYLPGEYTYTSVDTVSTNTSLHFPMVGAINDSTIDFHHVGGLVVIRVAEMPAASGSLTMSSGRQLSGHFTVSNVSDEKSVMSALSNLDSSKCQVVFNFSGATAGKPGVFYLPVATGTYTDVTLTMVDETGTHKVLCDDLTLTQGGAVSISVADSEVTVGGLEDDKQLEDGTWDAEIR